MKLNEFNEKIELLNELNDIRQLEQHFYIMSEYECFNYFSNDEYLNEGVKEWLTTKKENVKDWYYKQSDTVKYIVGLNSRPNTLQNFASQINKWNRVDIISIQQTLNNFIEKMDTVLSTSSIGNSVKNIIDATKQKATIVINFIQKKYNDITSMQGWTKLIFSIGFSALISKLRIIKTKIVSFITDFSIENVVESLKNINLVGKIFDNFEVIKTKLMNIIIKSVGDLGGVTIFFNILKTMKEALSFVMAVLQRAKSKFDSVPILSD